MSSPLHAVIISWEGQSARARALADRLNGVANRVSVIYSNQAARRETGPGTWRQTPQSWYFGRKFQVALELLAPNERMLQIQADAAYDDWPALTADCAAAFDAHSDIGVWAPDLDGTPWTTELVNEGRFGATTLIRATQTDGVVWALSPPVLRALDGLEYGGNNLGWGIDWAAICSARRQGLAAVRDLRHRVRHPRGRRYDDGQAAQHMKVFLRDMPGELRADILTQHARLRDRARARDGPAGATAPLACNALIDRTPMLKIPTTTSNLSEISASAGAVYVRAGPDFLADAPFLQCGPQAFPFSRMKAPPGLDCAPRAFPLRAAGDLQKLNDLCDWQVPGWPILQVVADANHSAMRIPLDGALPLAPEDGDVAFLAELACHRARGALIVQLTDADGRVTHEDRIAFDEKSAGGTTPDGYQSICLALPARRGPQVLKLALDDASATHPAEADPCVFFVARPRIARQGAGRLIDPVTLHPGAGPANGAEWYCARLDPTRLTNHAVSVSTGGMQTLILPEESPEIRLKNDWGHAFDFEAAQNAQTVIWINGAPAFAARFDAGAAFLRLPQDHLTGQHSRMELRDPTGCRAYWSGWILPPRQLTPVDVLQKESALPGPADLFAQSPLRFKALRAHLAAGASSEEMAQLALALDALEAGHEKLALKPLTFPVVKNPDVSVIVPAHNKVRVTYAALCALLLAWNRASFEVILVDDGSTDETARIETLVSGVRVVRNAAPQRFIRACNAGAKAARGKYVALLNNDAEPTLGWLDALIDSFERFPNVGLAGSKLLYPDGRLQDAGGIVWGTGDPWNYGHGQNPWEPRFCYARQADYLSGAALMTTRAIWDELGGLSDYLEPMYFEDTDFAFKARDAGYATWFVPSSIVYHHEGLTSGTDIASGFKRFQETNRPKFKRRWARAYAGGARPGTAPDLEKDRNIAGRILFIDYTTPRPDQDAGGLAAVQEMRLVQSLGYKATFLPENLAYMGRYTEDLERMGVEMARAPFHLSIEEFLQDRGAEFDAFYVTRYHVAKNVAPLIRAVNPAAPIIMNNADLHCLRLLRKAVSEDDDAGKAAARQVQAEEFAAMRSVDMVLSYTEAERAIIEAQSEGEVRVMPCPWVVDCASASPGFDARAGLSFLGGFRHHPNVEGMEWFAREVMARLASKRPDIALSIYGSGLCDRIKALETDGISPVGFIEDVAQAFGRHRVFVAPLLSGAGIKGKALSALAHGAPCVLSPIAAEGIGLAHGRDCLIARTPDDWVAAILRLYDDRALWETLAANGRELIRLRYSFDHGRAQMQAALEAIDLYAHGALTA